MSALIARLDSEQPDFQRALGGLLVSPAQGDREVVAAVEDILGAVEREGDEALLAFTRRFDGRTVAGMSDLTLEASDLSRALDAVPAEVRQALESAAMRIETFHQRQRAESWRFNDADGNELGQRISPLDRVGIYVPGGKASYPSSVLMNAIPAKVAGVGEILMVAPAPGGDINPVVLAAAALAGVDRVFTIGGAQAVAALAFGTETIARVDKIVGPGNRYVAEAKRQVFGRVGIDMVAGPSEVLIIADGSVDPKWMVMDLFAQAEHDEYAQSMLVCPDQDYLDTVAELIQQTLPEMSRAHIIGPSLKNRGALIKVRDIDEAVMISNRVAPEHLELAVESPESWLPQIKAAGAIFLGARSSEALGDYCAGPNHVLPTSGSARFASPLGVYDFQRRSSVISISDAGARSLGLTAAILADSESLEAHARSARLRISKELQ